MCRFSWVSVCIAILHACTCVCTCIRLGLVCQTIVIMRSLFLFNKNHTFRRTRTHNWCDSSRVCAFLYGGVCVWRRFCVCICVFLYLSVCARYGLTDLSILLSFLRISVLHVDFDDFCAYVNVCASSFLSVCLCAMRYGYILRQPDAMPFQCCWLYRLSASWAAACVSCSFFYVTFFSLYTACGFFAWFRVRSPERLTRLNTDMFQYFRRISGSVFPFPF